YGLHPITPEAPWKRYDERRYVRAVSGQCRDWLLAPTPLTPDFHRAVRRWLIAILACDETTNLLTPGGSPFPDAWNAPYLPSARAPAPRRPYAARRLRAGLAALAALARRGSGP
ncbi:FkbM family methyltransferase, partial [Streptomyces sp. MCAF7]